MPITEAWAGPAASTARPLGQLPDIFLRRHSLTLEAGYMVVKGLHLSARYGFDEWVVTDWQQQGNPNLNVNPSTGSANALLLGNNLFPYYHAHRLAVIVRKDL